MIKANFHSNNIRVIVFRKFGRFIPAREHLFKALSWNAVTVFLVLVLLDRKVPSATVPLPLRCEAILAPQVTAPSCGPPPTPPRPPHWSPGPWNFPYTKFPTQQALPPTVESLWSPFVATASGHNGLLADFKHLTETFFQATTIKKTASAILKWLFQTSSRVTSLEQVASKHSWTAS